MRTLRTTNGRPSEKKMEFGVERGDRANTEYILDGTVVSIDTPLKIATTTEMISDTKKLFP